MEIYSNVVAKGVLNRLNKNQKDQTKAAAQVASGMKINSAQDDASAYSISEKMRDQIRSLSQCGANTKTGGDMLAVAEGAVDNQIQIMKKLREIALKASDDTYSQEDRDTLQGETNQLLMQLNDISYDTNYNGRQLLNGVEPGEQVTKFDYSGKVTDNTVDGVVPVPNGISDGGGYGITGYGPQMYQLISVNSAGIPITYDPATIVTTKMTLDFTAGTSLSVNSTVYDSAGTAHGVLLDNNGVLSIWNNGGYQPIVDNNGLNSQLTAVSSGGFVPYTASYAQNTTTPAVGQTITLSSQLFSQQGTYGTEEPSGAPAVFGMGTLSNQKLDFSGVTKSGAAITLPADLDNQGFSIMCNGCSQFVSIKFDANMPGGTGQHYVDTTNGNDSEAYVIGIQGATTADAVGKALMDGLIQASGAATGTNPVTITNYHSVILYAYTDSTTNTTSYYLRKSGPQFCLYNGFKGSIVTTGGERPYQNLAIQGNTPASSYTNLEFPNTTLNTLFPAADSTLDIEPKDTDYPNPWPTGSGYEELDEEQKKSKWREEVWPYPKKGAVASASCVRTRDSAQKFLGDIDQALKYLLDSSTTLGAQSQRMEKMNANVVTTHENTTASESTIRDADMAKSMTNYTKYQVLTQTAQSMLTQANQQTGSVLDLLK